MDYIYAFSKVICRYDVIFVMGLTERDFVSAFTDALNEYANLSESKVYVCIAYICNIYMHITKRSFLFN